MRGLWRLAGRHLFGYRAVWALLLMPPLAAVLLGHFSHMPASSGMARVAVYSKDWPLAGDAYMEFLEAPGGEEQALAWVGMAEVKAAVAVEEDLLQQWMEGGEAPARWIQAVEDVETQLLRTKVFAKAYPELAALALASFVRRQGIADMEEGELYALFQRRQQQRSWFQPLADTSGHIVSGSAGDGADTPVVSGATASGEGTHPLRGFLALWLFMGLWAARVYYGRERHRGLWGDIPWEARRSLGWAYTCIMGLAMGLSVLAALWLSVFAGRGMGAWMAAGLGGSQWRGWGWEIGHLALYALAGILCVQCLALFLSWRVMAHILPFLFLALCFLLPILADIIYLRPIQSCLPAFWYLQAAEYGRGSGSWAMVLAWGLVWGLGRAFLGRRPPRGD